MFPISLVEVQQNESRSSYVRYQLQLILVIEHFSAAGADLLVDDSILACQKLESESQIVSQQL